VAEPLLDTGLAVYCVYASVHAMMCCRTHGSKIEREESSIGIRDATMQFPGPYIDLTLHEF